MRPILLVAHAAVLALLAPTVASAEVWVFGDSNVDTGWYKTSPFSGEPKFDFDLANAAKYDIGKPTNNPGPMSVEVFAALFDAAARPANQGGTNYATSGAKNTVVNTTLNGGFPNAIPTVTQLGTYLRDHRPEARDLFVIDSGANDVSYAVSNLTEPAQTAYIRDQADKLAGAIRKLHSSGARYIIVANQPESFGTAALQAARHVYNTALKNALDVGELRLGIGPVKFAWGDANGVRQDIVADPALFNIQHFSNTSGETACPAPNPVLAITTAWALLCSAASPVTQPTAFAEHALFADDQHWASGAQKILGSYYYCLAIATWPQLRPFPFPLQSPRREPPTPCSAFKPHGPPV